MSPDIFYCLSNRLKKPFKIHHYSSIQSQAGGEKTYLLKVRFWVAAHWMNIRHLTSLLLMEPAVAISDSLELKCLQLWENRTTLCFYNFNWSSTWICKLYILQLLSMKMKYLVDRLRHSQFSFNLKEGRLWTWTILNSWEWFLQMKLSKFTFFIYKNITLLNSIYCQS